MSSPEDDFFAANDALGRAIAALDPQEKEVVAKLYEDVKEFASQQQIKGMHLDKAAFFAAGIILHPEISSDSLVQAAVALIEKDWLLAKSHQQA
jgi:hypothetical protein